MKHYLLLISTSLTAVMMLAGCSKDNPDSEQTVDSGKQITFTSMVDKTTKGYVTSTTMYDTESKYLHDEFPTTTPRQLQVSAYLTPQNGDAGNYFVNYTFTKEDASENWRHNPPIYWPINGNLDFLAYSSKTGFQPNEVDWNEKNASSSVTLQVDSGHSQDEILYASTQGATSSTGVAVSMEFHHSQSWIQFQVLMKDESMNDKLAIESIELENIYNSGELSISRTDKEPSIIWNFKHESKKNCTVDENEYNKVYGRVDETDSSYPVINPITDVAQYLDMLIPPQTKTAIVINYVYAGQPYKLSYRYALTSGAPEWEAEAKYVYQIEFVISEVTLTPEVRVHEKNEDELF